MKLVHHDNFLFALTHPGEIQAMQELRAYLESMYFAN